MWKVTLRQLMTNIKKNAWLLVELFFVTIIVWYAIDFLWVIHHKKSESTGINTEHVYQLTVGIHPDRWKMPSDKDSLDIVKVRPQMEIRKILADDPRIESAAFYIGTDPISSGMMFQGYTIDDKEKVIANIRYVTPEYFDVLQVDIQDGKVGEWSNEFPQNAVLSEDLAMKLFGKANVIGEEFHDYYVQEAKYKVVAVSAPMKFDYFREYEPFIYTPLPQIRLRYQNPIYVFRVKASEDNAGFAEEFFEEMRDKLAVGPFYLEEVKAIDDVEQEYLNDLNIPRYISIATGVVLFFLFIVFLGVLGTYWFQIERRRNEVGIRMALGSSRSMLHRYLIRESTLLLLMAYIPAFIVCVLLAHFGITYTFKECMPYTWGRFAWAQLLTFITLFIIVVLGTWVPAYRASKLNPVDALSEE